MPVQAAFQNSPDRPACISVAQCQALSSARLGRGGDRVLNGIDLLPDVPAGSSTSSGRRCWRYRPCLLRVDPAGRVGCGAVHAAQHPHRRRRAGCHVGSIPRVVGPLTPGLWNSRPLTETGSHAATAPPPTTTPGATPPTPPTPSGPCSSRCCPTRLGPRWPAQGAHSPRRRRRHPLRGPQRLRLAGPARRCLPWRTVYGLYWRWNASGGRACLAAQPAARPRPGMAGTRSIPFKTRSPPLPTLAGGEFPVGEEERCRSGQGRSGTS
jgi:hypothetical protein